MKKSVRERPVRARAEKELEKRQKRSRNTFSRKKCQTERSVRKERKNALSLFDKGRDDDATARNHSTVQRQSDPPAVVVAIVDTGNTKCSLLVFRYLKTFSATVEPCVSLVVV